MNTAELVRHMCDGSNSLNQIISLLAQCGHDRLEVFDSWMDLAVSGSHGVRYVRVPRTVEGEEIGLDEPALYPLDNQ